MEALNQELATVYRQLTGSSVRDRASDPSTRGDPKRGAVRPRRDAQDAERGPSHDADDAEPHHAASLGSAGKSAAPQEPTPPTGATLTVGRGGLEVVNFRDPSQRETGRTAGAIPARRNAAVGAAPGSPRRPSSWLLWREGHGTPRSRRRPSSRRRPVLRPLPPRPLFRRRRPSRSRSSESTRLRPSPRGPP